MRVILLSVLAVLGACCWTPTDRYAELEPQTASLDRRVAALESRLAEHEGAVDAIDGRIERVENATPGIGYHRASWRIVSTVLSDPDVRLYEAGNVTRIVSSFTFRRRLCPSSVRVRVYAWTDEDLNDPTLTIDRRADLSPETCSATVYFDDRWVFVERVEFAD